MRTTSVFGITTRWLSQSVSLSVPFIRRRMPTAAALSPLYLPTRPFARRLSPSFLLLPSPALYYLSVLPWLSLLWFFCVSLPLKHSFAFYIQVPSSCFSPSFLPFYFLVHWLIQFARLILQFYSPSFSFPLLLWLTIWCLSSSSLDLPLSSYTFYSTLSPSII